MRCYFCNGTAAVNFQEHYIFCPDCAAIYTFMIVHKSGCKHINENIPTVFHHPWYKEARKKPYVIAEDTLGVFEQCQCSICGKQSIVDGW